MTDVYKRHILPLFVTWLLVMLSHLLSRLHFISCAGSLATRHFRLFPPFVAVGRASTVVPALVSPSLPPPKSHSKCICAEIKQLRFKVAQTVGLVTGRCERCTLLALLPAVNWNYAVLTRSYCRAGKRRGVIRKPPSGGASRIASEARPTDPWPTARRPRARPWLATVACRPVSRVTSPAGCCP